MENKWEWHYIGNFIDVFLYGVNCTLQAHYTANYFLVIVYDLIVVLLVCLVIFCMQKFILYYTLHIFLAFSLTRATDPE